MEAIHRAVAELLVPGYLVTAIWAFAAHFRRASRLADSFWRLQRLLAALVGFQVLLGILLLLAGRPLPEGLHLLYGLLVLLAVGAAEMLRPGGRLHRFLHEATGLQEPLVLALLGLFLFGVAGRALMTGLGL